MKVVLDTNIWLSGIFWQGNPYKIIKLAEQRKIEIIISRDIIEEIIEVLNRDSRFQRFIENRKASISDLIKTTLYIATLIETKTKIHVIKEDPDDDKILEAAVDGKADYIISGDRHLLDLSQFNEIKIIKAKEFLENCNTKA